VQAWNAPPVSRESIQRAEVIRATEDPRGYSVTPGYIGHLALALILTPDGKLSPPIAMEQWCLPARRQHAGKPASASELKAGLNSEKLKSASSRIAGKRRMASW
jgi:hypothetical protein